MLKDEIWPNPVKYFLNGEVEPAAYEQGEQGGGALVWDRCLLWGAVHDARLPHAAECGGVAACRCPPGQSSSSYNAGHEPSPGLCPLLALP